MPSESCSSSCSNTERSVPSFESGRTSQFEPRAKQPPITEHEDEQEHEDENHFSPLTSHLSLLTI
jgi:hypothetical protein